MKCFRSPITLLLLLLHEAAHAAPAAGPTRLQAVIELLEDMVKKGREAKLDEAKLWGKYESRFCNLTVRKTEHDIDEATEDIMMLEADVEGWSIELSKLGRGIKKAQEEVSAWKNDTVALDAAHKKKSAENVAVIQDHKESVYALEGAIQTLPGHDDTVAQEQAPTEGADGMAAQRPTPDQLARANAAEAAASAAASAAQDMGETAIQAAQIAAIAAVAAGADAAAAAAAAAAAGANVARGANALQAAHSAFFDVWGMDALYFAASSTAAAVDLSAGKPGIIDAVVTRSEIERGEVASAAASAAGRNAFSLYMGGTLESSAARIAAIAAVAAGADYAAAVTAGAAAAEAVEGGVDVAAATAAAAEQAFEAPDARAAAAAAARAIDDPADPAAAAATAAAAAAEALEAYNPTPEVSAYDYQSGGILGTLEGLLVKFKDELAAAEQKKTDDENKYTTERKQLQDNIKMTEESIQRKEKEMARVKTLKDTDEESLAETQSKLKVDVEYLDNLRTTCSSKASAFESRQALRAEELDTLFQVIKVLQSDTVSSRDLVQAEGGAALAAMRGAVAGDGNQKQRVLGFLMRRASTLKSDALEEFASLISQGGPFTNVKKMIQDLIERLEKEARNDADHDYRCQRELKMNEESRTSKKTKAKRLEADIAELNVQIEVLTTEMEDLTTQVNDLNADLKNATAIRESESAENLATIKDAGETQKALAGAITFLRDFYIKAGAATAFVQDNPEVPAIFDSSYKGMQTEGSNVDAFLKVLLSDFAKLEHETKVQERKAAAEHTKYEDETKLSITSFAKDIEYKTKESTAAKKAQSTAEAELEANAKALSLANEEYEALKPQCVYIEYEGRHEDRVAQRQLEVQSLEEALEILQGFGSLDEATMQAPAPPAPPAPTTPYPPAPTKAALPYAPAPQVPTKAALPYMQGPYVQGPYMQGRMQ